MSKWRQQAFVQLPALRRQLGREKTLYGFCGELYDELCRAYEGQNEDLIRDIFIYSKWCLNQPRNGTIANDPPTAIIVCFFEHLPEKEKVRKDLARHFSREFLISMEKVFQYHGSEDQYFEIIDSSS